MNEFPHHESTVSPEKQVSQFDISVNTISSDLHPEDNQDFYFKLPNSFGVFDGLGGYKGGRQAAIHASEAIRDVLVGLKPNFSQDKVINALNDGFKTANKEILDAQKHNGTNEQTTGTYGFIRQENGKCFLELASIGDSRAYLFRDGNLYTLTQDHNHIRDSYKDLNDSFKIQEYLDNYDGSTAVSPDLKLLFQNRHSISRSIGSKTSFPDLYTYEISKGDILLLCTDGVSDNLTKNEIESIIAKNQSQSSYEISKNLVLESSVRSRQRAVRSKPDDMTALVVHVNSDPEINSASPKTISYRNDRGQIETGAQVLYQERSTGRLVIKKTNSEGVALAVKISPDQVVD